MYDLEPLLGVKQPTVSHLKQLVEGPARAREARNLRLLQSEAGRTRARGRPARRASHRTCVTCQRPLSLDRDASYAENPCLGGKGQRRGVEGQLGVVGSECEGERLSSPEIDRFRRLVRRQGRGVARQRVWSLADREITRIVSTPLALLRRDRSRRKAVGSLCRETSSRRPLDVSSRSSSIARFDLVWQTP